MVPMTRRSSSMTAAHVWGVEVRVSRTTSRWTDWWIGAKVGSIETLDGPSPVPAGRLRSDVERDDTDVAALWIDERRGVDVASLHLWQGSTDSRRARHKTHRAGAMACETVTMASKRKPGEDAVRGRLGPTAQLAAVDGVVVAPHDQRREADGHHRRARSSDSVPVISATMSITASGAREMLPKQAIIPTMTYGAGSWPRLGTIGSSRRQTAAPTKAPITMPGPKMPPDPPEPIESPVVAMRAKGRMSTIQSGMCSSWLPSPAWIQP